MNSPKTRFLAPANSAPLKDLGPANSAGVNVLAPANSAPLKILNPCNFRVNPCKFCTQSLNSFEALLSFEGPNAFQSGANLSRFATISRPPKKTFCTDGAKAKAFYRREMRAQTARSSSLRLPRQEARQQQQQQRVLLDAALQQRRSERGERGDSGVSGHRQGIDRADRVLLRSRGEPVFTTIEYNQSYRIFTSEGGVR